MFSNHAAGNGKDAAWFENIGFIGFISVYARISMETNKTYWFSKGIIGLSQKTNYSFRNNWFTIPYTNPSRILHKFIKEIPCESYIIIY